MCLAHVPAAMQSRTPDEGASRSVSGRREHGVRAGDSLPEGTESTPGAKRPEPRRGKRERSECERRDSNRHAVKHRNLNPVDC
jgi:hypothetical protein